MGDRPVRRPGVRVLRNLLGITDPALLRQVEADITAGALVLLSRRTLPGRYDLAHLCRFHQQIFGRLYPWAGEIRTVAIAKTDLFCLPQHIEPYADEVFSALAGERHLRGLPRPSFVERLSHYFAEINALHPFREGNGRTQRAFLGQLARAAGWRINWRFLDPDRNVEAWIASLRGDNEPLHQMLDDLVTDDQP